MSGGKWFRIFGSILGVGLNINAPMANAFRTKIVITNSNITSTRILRMKVIKPRRPV